MLTMDSLSRDLTRKKYIEIMEATNYGWNTSGDYSHISCPSDIEGINKSDEPFKGECHGDCKECWKYVLNNKWGVK